MLRLTFSREFDPSIDGSIIMSATEPAISHLTQQELSGKDKAIIEELMDWLSGATFKKENDFELCVDDSLSEKWRLLKDMEIVQKV